MALTDPEIVAMGYDLPKGTDWVRDGDNNISKNARTTANALVDLEERLPRNRGILPDGTDLDDCFGPEWAGTWALYSANTYYNLPQSFNSSVNLEIISPLNSALSSTQRINVGGLSDQPTVGVYWRESNRSSGTGIWFDWYHIPAQPVGSESIRTIRTSTNPAATAGPDELLIILES